MSEKYLLRLDTKSVMRKSVKVVKAKRHKLQWCACARPREERGWKHFLRGLSCFLATLSRGEVILAKYCSGRLHSACSIVRGFGINLRCSEKNSIVFEKTSHVFEKTSHVFEKISYVFEKISHVFSVLSYVLNYTSSEGEREIMNFWGFRFDVLKRGSTL